MVSKKLLQMAIAGLTGVASLGLSTFSFAGGEFAPAPAPAPMVEESGNTGFYVGARAGYGDSHWNRNIALAERQFLDIKHTGFAGGVNVGYAFNKFIGIEGGYTYLPNGKVTVDSIPGFSYSEKAQNYAFDISAKVTLPVPALENVGVYGKVGVGFLNSKLTAYANGEQDGSSAKVHATKVTYGVGAYWDVASNIRLDAGWQRFHGATSNRNDGFAEVSVKQPNMDAFTVGVSYFFGGAGDLFNS